MAFELTILGSSSAKFAYERYQSAQVIHHNQHLYLIDCGEATQLQLDRCGFSFNKIEKIFISHLHGDHYFGLIGLLTTMHLIGRTKPLQIYCPAGLKEIIDVQLRHSESELLFNVEYIFTNATTTEVLFENDAISICSFPLRHRIACTGFLFKEKPKKYNIIKESLPEGFPPLQIIALKNGEDTEWEGKTYRYKDHTYTRAKSYTYAYCSDTLYTEELTETLHKIDWLYHEATFLHELLPRAIETGHTTALQAAQFAQKAQVGNLIIGHFSSRYKHIDKHLEEAQAVFPDTRLAEEGKTIKLDYI